MYRPARWLAIAVIAVSSFGVAGAHSPNANSDCAGIGDEAELTVAPPPEAPSTGQAIYVDTEADHNNSATTPGVWVETNALAGLQTHQHVCTNKSTKQIVTIAADSRAV